MQDNKLNTLRAEIDALDEAVIRLLGQRFVATQQVGQLKASQQLDAVDPAREARQVERYAALAVQHGVSEDVVQRVFRVVIDEVVQNHKALRSN